MYVLCVLYVLSHTVQKETDRTKRDRPYKRDRTYKHRAIRKHYDASTFMHNCRDLSIYKNWRQSSFHQSGNHAIVVRKPRHGKTSSDKKSLTSKLANFSPRSLRNIRTRTVEMCFCTVLRTEKLDFEACSRARRPFLSFKLTRIYRVCFQKLHQTMALTGGSIAPSDLQRISLRSTNLQKT